MFGVTIYASKLIDGFVLRADFHRDTGRLRILQGEVVLVERCPPHAWLEIASVAGYSISGPRPSEKDLDLLLDEFQCRRPCVASAIPRTALDDAIF